MAHEPSHETAINQPMSQQKTMGEVQKSLNEWAQIFNIPYGTFKSWAAETNKRSPFHESDARFIAAYGAGKALKARGNTKAAGQKNYTNIMEILNND